MMGLFNQATSKMGYKPRGADEDKVPDDTEPDDTSILSVSSALAMRYLSLADPCVDVDEYRDENEGSIIASLISQLRRVLAHPPPPGCGRAPSDASRAQSWHGSPQSDLPDLRTRAPQHARAHHRLYVPSRSPLRVRFLHLS